MALPCPTYLIGGHCTTGVRSAPRLDSAAMPSLDHPAHRRVLEAAHRKGVELEITVFSESTHTAAAPARDAGAEIAKIVKTLVPVAPRAAERVAVVALVSGANRVDVARLAAVVA